jgi:phage-related protein
MIPILYERSSAPRLILNDNSMGMGLMTECVKATVTEVANGSYELEIEYPVTGRLFKELRWNTWIKAKPFVGGDVQLFRVYKVSPAVNGICTVYAEHLSYLLTNAVVGLGLSQSSPPSVNPVMALDIMEANIIVEDYAFGGRNAFTYICNKPGIPVPFIRDKARSVREYLLGDEYSMLTMYGKIEYEFNNFNVYLWADDDSQYSRGHDNGVKIQYGKNMLNMKLEESDENVITDFYPYIVVHEDTTSSSQYNYFLKRDIEDYSSTASRIVHNEQSSGYWAPPRVLPLNLKDFERWKDVSFGSGYSLPIGLQDFYDCVNQYMDAHPDISYPVSSIDVSFIDLSTTDEYKNVIPLQSVNMFDIVTVEYPEWYVKQKFQVVKTEFNVLEERYNNITLGVLRKTLT